MAGANNQLNISAADDDFDSTNDVHNSKGKGT